MAAEYEGSFQETSSFSNTLSDLSYSFWGYCHQLERKLSDKVQQLSGKRSIRSAHQNWDNHHFCEMASEENYSVEELLNLLDGNFDTFSDEYCLGEIVSEYDLFHFSEDSVRLGISGEYKENLVTNTQRFTEKLAQTGRLQQRAVIESENGRFIQEWAERACQDESIPVGAKIIWSSPPGLKLEGYGGTGKNHHSFVWVYEKRLDEQGLPKVTMVQYRCWPSLQQLNKFQASLQEKLGGKTLQTAPSSLILTKRNRCISTLIEIPAEQKLSDIVKELYRSRKKWSVQPEDMPQLTTGHKAKFKDFRQIVLEKFLRRAYTQLLYPHQGNLSLSKAHEFWKSPQYALLISQLDNTFALAYQGLLKFIDDCEVAQQIQDVPPVIEDRINQLWQLFSLLLEKGVEEFDQEESKTYNSLASSVLSIGKRVGGRALTVGQCGVGAMLPTQVVKNLSTMIGNTRLGSSEFSFLRNAYRPLELLSKTGQKTKIWVLRQHFSEYAGRCKEVAPNVWHGPCNILLDERLDNLILSDTTYRNRILAASAANLPKAAGKKTESHTPVDTHPVYVNPQLEKRFRRRRVSVLQFINKDY